MEQNKAFQEQIPNNHCFGCGSENALGLQIKSYWHGSNESVCTFTPLPHHSAGPLHFLNGGIISTIIDCHCVCTAIAKGYKMQDREIGSGETIWFATGSLDVKFLRPVSINEDVKLIASIIEAKDSKIELQCELFSDGILCCQSHVVAVKVPSEWFQTRG
ncbi:PaaI family thioesterase [Vibrio sp. Isolate23]|uniref:PaaI family thioesterase n=1 Tax=Vibrio sp. Isolate23 TaxID=2908533 RepID=UPI001EFD35F9|nr:PaaI family thioesterase [Vibrio sp. Isolate23]MCG9681956.1 PaaI family thioesterase [Vibrio sp. Isolate23]